ncbi:MAG: hypothetical protein RL154_1059 [Pseudomonadota bacterium]|jgi:DHA1 family bicyclomycin/chloramphenicol resistance-like MFS transporter
MSLKNLLLSIMTALFFIGMAATDIYISSLPTMAEEFNTSPEVVNLTLSAYNGSMAIFVLFAAVLSERFGRRKVMIFAATLFCACAFLISIASDIWVIISLRAVQAIGTAFVVVVSREVFKDTLDEREQLRANAIILLGLVLSPALAPIIGAYLSEHFGWRSCFVFIGAVSFPLTLLVIKFLPETCKYRINKLPTAKNFFLDYFRILKNRYFLFMTLTYISSNGAFYTFIGISSYMYIENYQLSQLSYAYIYAFIATAYLAGNQFMLYLNKRNAPYAKILNYGITYTAVGAIATLAVSLLADCFTALVIVTLASALMRASGAMINPTTQVLTMNHFKDDGGMALALSMSVMFIVMSFSISAISLFSEHPVFGIGLISTFFSLIGMIGFRLVKNSIRDR